MPITPARVHRQRALLAAGGVLVPLAVVAAAVGLITIPTTGHLRVAFWAIVTAIVSIFAAWASHESALRSQAWARFGTAAGAVAVAAAIFVIGLSAADVLTRGSDSPCNSATARARLMSLAQQISVPPCSQLTVSDGHTYWLTVMRSSRAVWVTVNEGQYPW